jgi:hypothetical protein
LRPAAVAHIERAAGAGVDALLARPDFVRLLAACRALEALPEAERLVRLEGLAWFVLEQALAEGNWRCAAFVLAERRLGRNPARTLAQRVVTRQRRAAKPPAVTARAAEPAAVAAPASRSDCAPPRRDPAARVVARAGAACGRRLARRGGRGARVVPCRRDRGRQPAVRSGGRGGAAGGPAGLCGPGHVQAAAAGRCRRLAAFGRRGLGRRPAAGSGQGPAACLGARTLTAACRLAVRSGSETTQMLRFRMSGLAADDTVRAGGLSCVATADPGDAMATDSVDEGRRR